jgi:1-phosphofructokinase
VIIAVTPNPGLDRTLVVRRLRRGALHRVPRATVEPGGKGINVARVLSAHGIATQAVFPAGGPEGDALVAMLTPEIPVRCVAIAAPLRVNVAVVEPGGQVTKLNEEGPELSSEDAQALLAAVRDASRGASWVVSCGSLPRGLSVDFHAQVVAAAHAEGARAAVDASGDAFVAALAAGPDLVKPNREELEEAMGWPIETFGDAITGAHTLLQRGARRVLASFGSAGAVLLDGDGAMHGIAPCEQVQSTVGAGDALLAGFLAADGAPADALRQAVEWAAQSVATPGNGVAALGLTPTPAGVVSAEIEPARRLDEEQLDTRLLVGEVTVSLDGLVQSRERSEQ